jgi:hypothetical protein
MNMMREDYAMLPNITALLVRNFLDTAEPFRYPRKLGYIVISGHLYRVDVISRQGKTDGRRPYDES